MFQMVRPGSVSDASHLSYARFFFSFFFSALVLYKREKILTCCQMRNKPKFSKKCSFSCSALSFLAVSQQRMSILNGRPGFK